MSEESELPISIQELGACGFGGSQLSAMLAGFRHLSANGFALEDVADAIYSDPSVSSALEHGDYEKARDLIATSMGENLTVIKGSRIQEDRLWALTESGLAVGEISWAIRNIQGFQENLLTLDPEDARRHGQSTYEFFRKDRRTRRITRTTRWGTTIEGSIDPKASPESWFEHYSKIVSCAGVDRVRKGSPSTSSIFGNLADPNYSMWDEMIQRDKDQKAQIEQRMRGNRKPDLPEDDTRNRGTHHPVTAPPLLTVGRTGPRKENQRGETATQAKNPRDQTFTWIVFIIVIIGTIVIFNLASSR